jgi:cytoskeletal protein RodZ
MAGKHSKKKSKKPLVIALISVLVVAVIAACVIVAFFTDFSFDSQTSTTNQTTAATSQTTENTTAIPQTSVAELTDTTTQSSAQEETTSQSNSDDDSSKANEAVVSPVQNDEDADYFEATYSPYKAVDSSTGNECSLKEVFGSSYSGGSITFGSDGSFSDTLSLSSANSGVYALTSGSIIATYTNDKNVSITVTNWENDTPTEIIINYGGYDVYFS